MDELSRGLAVRGCRNRNAHLVTIASEIENNFVLAGAQMTSWIGLRTNSTSGMLYWEDHAVVDQYANWDNQEGQGECVVITRNGTWRALACTRKFNFTCKRPGECSVSIYKRINFTSWSVYIITTTQFYASPDHEVVERI